jgi:hypothetical protein
MDYFFSKMGMCTCHPVQKKMMTSSATEKLTKHEYSKVILNAIDHIRENAIDVSSVLASPDNEKFTFSACNVTIVPPTSDGRVNFNEVFVMYFSKISSSITTNLETIFNNPVYATAVHVTNDSVRLSDITNALRFQSGVRVVDIKHFDLDDDEEVAMDRLVLARNFKHGRLLCKIAIDKPRMPQTVARLFR